MEDTKGSVSDKLAIIDTKDEIETTDKLAIIDNRRLPFKDKERDLIEKICSEDFNEDEFIDSLIAFEDIGRTSRNSTEQYIKAVQFTSYVIMGETYTYAYKKTFPDRAMNASSEEHITSYASIYANGKLVKEIMQRMTLHNAMLFKDKEFKARKELFNIGMDESQTGKSRVEALKVFLDNQYREQKDAGINVNINAGGSSAIDDINQALTQLANKQKDAIEAGYMDLKDVVEAQIVDEKDN